MANQQLVDYLKEQLELGAEREHLKQSLLGVGWSLSDVEEAFSVVLKELNLNENNQVSIPEVPKENLVDLTSKKDFSLKEDIQKESVQKEAVQKPVSDSVFVSKDAFISSFPLAEAKSKEPVISSKEVNLEETKKQEQSFSNIELNKNMKSSNKLKLIFYVLLGIVIAGLLSLIFFLYRNNQNLQNQITNFSSEKNNLDNQNQSLSKILSEIQNQINVLKDENNLLREESLDLQNQLLLFNQSTSSLDITLKGKILLDKNQYVLKTNKDIIVSIKNSKDAKVKEILDSFLNNEVKVFGQRTPGLREITIKTINDKSLEDLISQKEVEKTVVSTTTPQIQTSTNSNIENPEFLPQP